MTKIIAESVGDVFVEQADAKSKGSAELLLKEERASQSEAVEGLHFSGPVQLSEGNREILDEKEMENSEARNEQELQELLRNINEEALHLSEFLVEEDKLIDDLCESLKQILEKLHMSFNISPRDIPVKKKVKKAVLNEEGHLIFVYGKGEVHSAFLAEYPPEIVMAILWLTMAELAEAIRLYRKRLSRRVNFFGRVKKELKGALKAMAGSK